MTKALVVYDSLFGNTEKIAQQITKGLEDKFKVELKLAGKVEAGDLEGIDLLVIGSPVHGGRPTPAVQQLLNNISNQGLKGIKVAAFDTRFAPKNHGAGLKLLMRMIGYAAEKMDRDLTDKGGERAIAPEGFIVLGKEGPLEEGEQDRALEWAKNISR